MPSSSSDSEDSHGESRVDHAEEMEGAREEGKQEAKANGDVVTTQPCSSQLRDWHDGLCSCHKDVGNCFLVAFCPLCAAAYEFHKHNENPILGFCFPGPFMALVSQYRIKKGILLSQNTAFKKVDKQKSKFKFFQGSLCTDCLATYFCGFCVLCRLHRDFKHASD
ncbi:unnamed protein product [Hydatigera taeniaeformis]|uniref:PLAC8 family protein n=1 Tax=Hydatigena taeniaeformis TaxID=6205 RepID=A0A0R3WZR0_HYDTA|nr:unnamed protein product [Hydatigera taeniaeformis]